MVSNSKTQSSQELMKELDYFPHPTIREGQRQLVEDILVTFKEKKVLLAHAPTGLGKTASALAVALQILNNSEAREKEDGTTRKKKVFFLTNRHTQHKIAVDTLKEIKNKRGHKIVCVDLIGKRWMCNQEIAGLFGNDFNEFCKSIVEKGECEFLNNVKNGQKLTMESKLLLKNLQNMSPLHNEELIVECKEQQMCSYEMSIMLGKDADVFIGDYYYLFNPYVMIALFKKMDLELEDVILVVDEGHNLPNRVMDMLSSNLTTNMLKNGLMEAKKFHFKGMINWLQELNRILINLADFKEEDRNKEKLVTKDSFLSEVQKVVNYEELIDELEQAAEEIRKKQKKSYLGGISTFLESWKGDDEGYLRSVSDRTNKYGPLITLSYSCLDPRVITTPIFERVHSSIIMSGTLNPTSMYRDVLGIKKEKAVEKHYPSPFPAENKLDLIIPETTTKFTARGDVMYKKIAEICTKLNKLIPGNTALFFPSYYMRDQICAFLNSDKKLFWEKQSMSKEEKEQFLEGFKLEKNKRQGGILLGVAGANFAEGVDFPGDLLNGVIVVGLPLAKPDLKTKEIIKYYDNKFNRGWDYGYIYPAMNKCLQSAGRCIRSETDKGAVIYLEERFAWQKYLGCFPGNCPRVTKDYFILLNEFFR